MKIIILGLTSLFLIVSGDDVGHSSYSVLPYGEEAHGSHHGVGNYHEPSPHYGAPHHDYGGYSYEHDNDDYGYMTGYRMRNFMKKHFGHMKGYGKRMKKFFDNSKSKFYELHGSILRAKGHLLKNQGENMLRKAYNIKRQYEPQYYHPEPVYNTYKAPSYGAPEYHDNGYNVQHDSGYQAPHHNSHDSYGKSLDHGTSEAHHDPEGVYQAPSSNHLVHHKSSKTSRGIDFSEPKSKDVIFNNQPAVHQSSPSSLNDHFNHRRSALPSDVKRDYKVEPTASYEAESVPVPVSFYVQPSRLVFPQFNSRTKLNEYPNYH